MQSPCSMLQCVYLRQSGRDFDFVVSDSANFGWVFDLHSTKRGAHDTHEINKGMF